MTNIIAIANQKGGVGKTTTTYNLAYELVRENKRVLCIDLDMQTNLTKLLGIFSKKEIKFSLSDLFILAIEDGEFPEKKDYVLSHYNIDFIPSTTDLLLTDTKLQTEVGTDKMLENVIYQIKDDYDYILLDLAPSFNTLTMNALAISDYVIIPTMCDLLSTIGINSFMDNVNKVKRRLNRKLEVMGVLLTKVENNLKLTQIMKEQLSETTLNLNVFNTEIPKSTEVGKGELELKPIAIYNPNNKVAIAYRNFTKEVIGV